LPNKQSKITITGSKSETNRLLLLQALYPQISIENISNSDDSEVMQMALKTSENTIYIHHAYIYLQQTNVQLYTTNIHYPETDFHYTDI